MSGSKRLLVVPAIAAAIGIVAGCAPAGAYPLGWRTDGTGKYADAKPMTEWADGKNIIWATPTASWSNSTPIIVGNRLFVCVEPATMLCLDATDGKVLWERSNEYKDLVDAAEAQRFAQEQLKADELAQQARKANSEANKLGQQVKDKPEDANLKAQSDAARQKAAEAMRALDPYKKQWYIIPPTHQVNGYSSCTPVSDGQKVWGVYGTGVVACYDLDGKPVWRKAVEKPSQDWGHSASPVLVGNKLIVHIVNMTALDKDTGEVLWQTRLAESWGSPVTTKVAGVDVVITPKGDVVRADDGKVVAKGIGKLDYCAPVVEDGVVYFIETGGRAVKLGTEIVGDQLPCTTLWTTQPKKDRYYASPAVHDGLIYACNQAGAFSVIDATTGEVVYEQAMNFGKGTVYPSVAYAGGFILVSSDNGTTVVVKSGRQYEEVARNRLEPFRSCPVFVGGRMYVRAMQKVYCIGAAGA